MAETFFKTFKFELLKRKEYKDFIAYIEKDNSEHNDHFNNILYYFKYNSSFLNDIPMEDRKRAIEEILIWFVNYTSKIQANKRLENLFPSKKVKSPKKPYTYIKKDLETIEKFRLLIFKTMNKDRMKEVNELLEITTAFKEDLESATFKIFTKGSYYKTDTETKQKLRNVFSNLIEEFNLKNYSKEIDNFISSI